MENVKFRRKKRPAQKLAKLKCTFCSRSGHKQEHCWENPHDPNNRLARSKFAKKQFRQKANFTLQNEISEEELCISRASKSRKTKHRTAVAKPKQMTDLMMLDSGTKSRMSPYIARVNDHTPCNISIALGHDSTVVADKKRIRRVNWYGQDGPGEVLLSETLVAPGSATSLLSVLALLNKVLFMPKMALLLDTENKHSVIGYAEEKEDVLHYITEQEDCASAAEIEVD